jgi:hypothetical protein
MACDLLASCGRDRSQIETAAISFTVCSTLNPMNTVQLAVHNHNYATALANLLERDGAHEVIHANQPDPDVRGVIVADGAHAESSTLCNLQPERFVVVVTRKNAGLLERIWALGVRHVVFEEDSPATAMLAVIAAELRQPQSAGSSNVAGTTAWHM